MSLFADYIRERGVFQIVEQAEGFATYTINGLECYIEDVYVAPEHRGRGIATQLVDAVSRSASEKGCKCLTTCVVPTAGGSAAAACALLSYGFKLLRSDINAVYFIKEL